jgi:hypothetical protein
MKKLLGVVLCLVILVAFAGCGSKTAITPAQFSDAVGGYGFSVSDALNEEDKALYDTMLYAEKGGDKLLFLVVRDAENPKSIFEGLKSQVEDLKGAVNASTSVSGGNSGKYTMTSGGKFYAVSQIGQTLIYTESDDGSKDEIKDILKELGY